MLPSITNENTKNVLPHCEKRYDSGSKGGFIEHTSLAYAAQQSAIKFIALFLINVVTPKAGDCRPTPENTKGGSITVPLTSCLTGLD